MKDRGWERLEAVFEAARDVEGSERRAILDRECADDPGLRREVESLLATVPLGEDAFERGAHAAARVVRDVAGLGDPVLGLHVDGWEIVRPVGSGGMATVYLALGGVGRTERAAVKVANPAADRTRFADSARLEAEVLASLDHPSIARFLGAGELPDGRRYTVMEFVDGVPITEHSDLRGLDVEARLVLFAEVCDAVAHAHRRLVVHRDLKPANVLVDSDGRPRVVDFGIAKVLEPVVAGEETRGGPATMLLTPEYTSPEQVRGERATTASDVYALGLLLYRLLAGVPAYRVTTTNPAEIVRVVCETDPPLASQAVLDAADAAEIAGHRSTSPVRLARRLRGDLDNVIALALRKEPAERYATVERLLDDVQRVLRGERAAARPRGRLERLVRVARRHRVAVAAVLGVSSVAAVGGVVTFNQASLARVQATTARTVTELLVGVVESAEPGRLEGLAAVDFVAGIEDRVGAEPGLDRRVVATIDAAVGRIYERLGEYDRALAALERARATFAEEVSVTARAEVAVCLARIGVCHLRLGHSDDATASFEAAIELGSGDDPALEATATAGLGALARERGDHAAAVRHSERALELRRTVLEPGHPDIVVAMNNLAAARWGAGDLEGTERVLLQAREAAGRSGLDNQPIGAQVLHNLGVLYDSLDQLERARVTLEEALALRRSILPATHTQVAETLYALAWVYQQLALPERAIELMESSLAIMESATPESWKVADARSALGQFLVECGRLEAAEPLLGASLGVLEAELGREHEHVQEAAQRWIDLLRATGRDAEADAVRERIPAAVGHHMHR